MCVILLSCGLETFVFLRPIENVSVSGVNSSEIVLPSQPATAADYFRNYTIYYRIYLSDTYAPTFTSDIQRNNVNTVLAQHFSTLDRYTANDSVSTSVIDTVFKSLNYFSLFVDDSGTIKSLSELLRPPAFGGSSNVSVRLEFNDFQVPILIVDPYGANISYPLSRADSFTSLPNRSFNYSDILINTIITKEENADVQARTGLNPTQYAYVSMYIIAIGIDSNYSPLYSRPTHIGIFNLPRL